MKFQFELQVSRDSTSRLIWQCSSSFTSYLIDFVRDTSRKMKSQTQEGEAQEYKLLFYSHSKILLPGNSGVAFIDFRAIEVFFFYTNGQLDDENCDQVQIRKAKLIPVIVFLNVRFSRKLGS